MLFKCVGKYLLLKIKYVKTLKIVKVLLNRRINKQKPKIKYKIEDIRGRFIVVSLRLLKFVNKFCQSLPILLYRSEYILATDNIEFRQ